MVNNTQQISDRTGEKRLQEERELQERNQLEANRQADDRKAEANKQGDDKDDSKGQDYTQADRIESDNRQADARQADDRQQEDRIAAQRRQADDRRREDNRRNESREGRSSGSGEIEDGIEQVAFQGESLSRQGQVGIEQSPGGSGEAPAPDQSRAGKNVLNPRDLEQQEGREYVDRPQGERVESSKMTPAEAALEREHQANARQNVALSDRLSQRAAQADSKAQADGKTIPPVETQEFARDADTVIQAHEAKQAKVQEQNKTNQSALSL